MHMAVPPPEDEDDDADDPDAIGLRALGATGRASTTLGGGNSADDAAAKEVELDERERMIRRVRRWKTRSREATEWREFFRGTLYRCTLIGA